MGTTVEELKKLYKKLGGKDKQVATFNQSGEVINAINELDLPTDYELPKVTTTDAGKILTVSDEGKWDAEIPVEPEPELPAVTAEDEGKVLTVNSEGEWDKAGVATFQLFGTSNSGQITIGGVSTWDQLISLINKGYTTLIVNTSYYKLTYLDNSVASFEVYDMNPTAKTLTRQLIKFYNKSSGQFVGSYNISTMNFAN